MYLIKKTKVFEKSYKKIKNSGIKQSTLEDLFYVVNSLSCGKNLAVSYKDHKLNGKHENYRECHIKGDLLLIYKIEKQNLILVLANIGSHSQLFG